MPDSLSRKVTIAMVGTRALYERGSLDTILAALEADPRFAPTTWSLEERGGNAYERESTLGVLDKHGGRPLAQTSLYLRRRLAPQYDARVALWTRPGLRITFDPKLAASDYPATFELADRLADLFQPDWGAAHVWLGARDRSGPRQPWANDDERDAEIMYSSAALIPIEYYGIGPLGLAMRTYIGPHFARQLGAERITALPVIVEQLPWHGFRVDLVREPWSADLQALLEAWRPAMALLREAGVLAMPKIKNGKLVDFAHSERCDVGGVVRDTD